MWFVISPIHTERAGTGNVIPYGVLQGYSVVILLLIGTLPSRYTRGNDLWFQHVAIIVSDMDRAYARLREHQVRYASTAEGGHSVMT